MNDLPNHRGKVIQLLQAIQRLPVSNPNEGGNEIRWPDLPNLRRLWADRAVDNNWRRVFSVWTFEQREGIRQDYIQEAHIGAQLVVTDLSGFPVLHGLAWICDALEKRYQKLDFEVPKKKKKRGHQQAQANTNSTILTQRRKISKIDQHPCAISKLTLFLCRFVKVIDENDCNERSEMMKVSQAESSKVPRRVTT